MGRRPRRRPVFSRSRSAASPAAAGTRGSARIVGGADGADIGAGHRGHGGGREAERLQHAPRPGPRSRRCLLPGGSSRGPRRSRPSPPSIRWRHHRAGARTPGWPCTPGSTSISWQAPRRPRRAITSCTATRMADGAARSGGPGGGRSEQSRVSRPPGALRAQPDGGARRPLLSPRCRAPSSTRSASCATSRSATRSTACTWTTCAIPPTTSTTAATRWRASAQLDAGLTRRVAAIRHAPGGRTAPLHAGVQRPVACVPADRLTTLVAELRPAVKAARPSAIVSAAVSPDPADAANRGCRTGAVAKSGSRRRRLSDGVYDGRAVFASQIAAAQEAAGRHPLWAGIGAHRLSSDQTLDNILSARRLGVGGIILFSYDSLVDPARGPVTSRRSQSRIQLTVLSVPAPSCSADQVRLAGLKACTTSDQH